MRWTQTGGAVRVSAILLFLAAPLGSCSKNDGDTPRIGGQSGKGGASVGGRGGSDAGSPGSSQYGGDGGAELAAGTGGNAGSTSGGRDSNAGQSPGGGAGDGGAAGRGNAGSGGALPTGCIDDFDCEGFSCCDGQCTNRSNDPFNCGICGVECEGETPYCGGTSCKARPCTTTCDAGETCCGSACCGAGEICCMRTIGGAAPECVAPVNGTCPLGCGDCG